MPKEEMVFVQYNIHGMYVKGGLLAVAEILATEEDVVQPGGTIVQVCCSQLPSCTVESCCVLVISFLTSNM